MKKILVMLCIGFVSILGQSCKILKSKEFQFEVAKVFTEQNIQRLFKLDKFRFSGTKYIDVQRSLPTAEIVDLIGKKLAEKITGNGESFFKNEKVKTFVVWETNEGKTSIRYFRQAL
jgi:hypothetical protein